MSAIGEQKKVEFPTDQVTGQQIKTEAGVPLDNDLARRQGQKLELVTNDQIITIKDTTAPFGEGVTIF